MHLPASIEWPFDTTDPKQLTMLRTVAERVAYSDIIRGLVHELRNPMQSMMIAAQALLDDSSNGTTLLDVIHRGSVQSAESIDLLGEVIGEQSHMEGPVPVQDVVLWAVNCQRISRFQINGQVEVQLPNDIPPVAADERDIGTILTLVLNNAKEAIGFDNQGTVFVTATLRDDDQGVVITIEDSGPGIGNNELTDIFEPYYSTKTSEHLGIGLPAARSLLSGYGAQIQIQNREQSGVRCELWLPKWVSGQS